MPQHLLATMITSTTFGTWLPGDFRGYVEDGVVLPGDPRVLDRSKSFMNATPVILTPAQQAAAFTAMCKAAAEFHY